MVCSLGSGQMATMATLLEARSTLQTGTEELGRWKLAAQYVHRELREADEANFLDEEDMHVFGLKPMTDPLNLVCCNSCKKPVKASQYATHAEICKSLNSAEEIIPDLDDGTGQKKPPRKERKKLITTCANEVASVAEPERSRAVAVNNMVTSVSRVDVHTQMTTSFAMEAKGREYPNESTAGCEKTCDIVIGSRVSRQIDDCYLQTKGKSDVPAPLATKIFYSQRNHRLRSALSHLHYESSAKQNGDDLVNMKVLQGHQMPSWTSSPKNFFHQQTDDQQEKGGEKISLPAMQKPDQSLAHRSEVYLDESGTCPPTMNFSNQFPLNNVSEPQRTPIGTIGNNYLSNAYSFAGNSGKPVRALQEPKGSVPVV